MMSELFMALEGAAMAQDGARFPTLHARCVQASTKPKQFQVSSLFQRAGKRRTCKRARTTEPNKLLQPMPVALRVCPSFGWSWYRWERQGGHS